MELGNLPFARWRGIVELSGIAAAVRGSDISTLSFTASSPPPSEMPIRLVKSICSGVDAAAAAGAGRPNRDALVACVAAVHGGALITNQRHFIRVLA